MTRGRYLIWWLLGVVQLWADRHRRMVQPEATKVDAVAHLIKFIK